MKYLAQVGGLAVLLCGGPLGCGHGTQAELANAVSELNQCRAALGAPGGTDTRAARATVQEHCRVWIQPDCFRVDALLIHEFEPTSPTSDGRTIARYHLECPRRVGAECLGTRVDGEDPLGGLPPDLMRGLVVESASPTRTELSWGFGSHRFVLDTQSESFSHADRTPSHARVSCMVAHSETGFCRVSR